MSGGVAYVLDEDDDFARRCNTQMVGLERLDDPEEIAELKGLIKHHAEYTRSQRAFHILVLWDDYIPKFVKVMPKDYKRVLQAFKRVREAGLTGDDAWMAAFEENARDLSRVGGG